MNALNNCRKQQHLHRPSIWAEVKKEGQVPNLRDLARPFREHFPDMWRQIEFSLRRHVCMGGGGLLGYLWSRSDVVNVQH